MFAVEMSTTMKLICQGAESRVYSTEYLSKPAVIKERLAKKYRIKELDTKINKQRLLQEARCLVKCRRAGVRAPCILLIDLENNSLYLERIIGQSLKEYLWQNLVSNRDGCIALAQQVGAAIGKMHDADIVHGDLTTSNLMVQDKEDGSPLQIVVIDFGLGMMKPTIEDKAVDLYVLERAFISTHPESEYVVAAVLEAFRFSCRQGTPILGRLEQVRMRGRKRDMLG